MDFDRYIQSSNGYHNHDIETSIKLPLCILSVTYFLSIQPLTIIDLSGYNSFVFSKISYKKNHTIHNRFFFFWCFTYVF